MGLARSAAGRGNPWLIASVIAISAFTEGLDTAIANVAREYIAGTNRHDIRSADLTSPELPHRKRRGAARQSG